MEKRRSILTKLISVFILIFVISLSLVTLLNSRIARRSLIDRMNNSEIPAYINNARSAVDSQLLAVADGLMVSAEDPFLRKWILAGEPEEDRALIEERLTFFKVTTIPSAAVSFSGTACITMRITMAGFL